MKLGVLGKGVLFYGSMPILGTMLFHGPWTFCGTTHFCSTGLVCGAMSFCGLLFLLQCTVLWHHCFMALPYFMLLSCT